MSCDVSKKLKNGIVMSIMFVLVKCNSNGVKIILVVTEMII
jgi:hypothetical protein